ncbi:DUF6286 domain-containing protein [Microbacterium arabinogalactanolyticum]|uniref:DUF6286 domain-containing protein n=1 Tax=Microbacterium arabinogalactanolyticum TaxID=69365 RepID=UPI004044F560
MTTPILKRATRRELHSPRTVAAATVLVLVALAAVYAGVEIVLHLLRLDPLLVTPGAALDGVAALPDIEAKPAVIAGAVVVGIAGLVLIWLALTPGRRPRHRLDLPPHSVVVDNAVIASSSAEHVRRELDLPRGAVVVGVGHRSADVTVRPVPGQAVDKNRLRTVLKDELTRYGLPAGMSVRARVLRPEEGNGER